MTTDHEHAHEHDHEHIAPPSRGHEHVHGAEDWLVRLQAVRESARHFYLHQFDWHGYGPPAGFAGPNFYPPTIDWRLIARLDQDVPGAGQKVTLATSTGQLREMVFAGQLVFTAGEGEHRLGAFLTRDFEGSEVLFVPFRDQTSGSETYGAGRYLEVPYDAGGGPIELDFNYAYNPSCVYSPAYDCPYPPPTNLLNIPVRAGETLPGQPTGSHAVYGWRTSTPSRSRQQTLIVLAIAAIAIVAVVGALFALGAGLGGLIGTPVKNVAVGQCFNGVDVPVGNGSEVYDVEVVDCSEPHQNEMIAAVTYPGAGDEYPGESTLAAFGEDQCYEEFFSYVGVTYLQSRLEMTTLHPSDLSWRFGDKSIQCVVSPPTGEERMTGSVRNSRR